MLGYGIVITDTDEHQVVLNERADLSSGRDDTAICAPVILESAVWIGSGSTVLKGVTIGSGAVVGAGSIVTKGVKPKDLVAGVLARIIRSGITWIP